jgi:hypothetical protein
MLQRCIGRCTPRKDSAVGFVVFSSEITYRFGFVALGTLRSDSQYQDF